MSHCGTVGLRRRGRGWEGVAGPPSSGRTWLQAHGHRRPRPQGQHGLGRWTKLRGAHHRLPCWGGAQALAVSTCGDVRVTRGRHPARGSCQSTPASGRRRGAEGPDAPRRACQRRRLQSQHSRSHAGRVGGPPSRGARASASGDREAPLSSAGSPPSSGPPWLPEGHRRTRTGSSSQSDGHLPPAREAQWPPGGASQRPQPQDRRCPARDTPYSSDLSKAREVNAKTHIPSLTKQSPVLTAGSGRG